VDASPIYTYLPHRRTEEKLEHASHPVKVSHQLPRGSVLARFNAWFAVKITNGVGTMWCAYAFAAIALVSLPAAISSHTLVVIVSWISQAFLQLFLLSVVIVGQNLLATAAEAKSRGDVQRCRCGPPRGRQAPGAPHGSGPGHSPPYGQCGRGLTARPTGRQAAREPGRLASTRPRVHSNCAFPVLFL
jgi:hypothetical protein